MDRITGSLLKGFVKDQELIESKTEDNFESFCNFSVISDEYNKSFDFHNISTGGGGDTALDGVAIIVVVSRFRAASILI